MNTPAILGGSPIRTKAFPQRVTMGKEEKDAVLKVMDSDVLSAFIGAAGKFFDGGPVVQEFEKAWANQYGFKHAISMNSWTSGLVAAIGAVGIEPGDEVICSPYTMSASATCALFYGGIPVFADIDPSSFCLDPRSIESKITGRTRAIVVVHVFGGTADMDAIMAIARPRGIKVIEDAAQAPGVLYKGRPVGAIGDAGGFSLNFHKHVHTGEGGMIVTQDEEVALRCRLIRNHGENAAETYGIANLSNIIGGNYRLTEIQAAIGIEQLKRLPGYLETRRALAEHLTKGLTGCEGLTPPRVENNCTHSFYVYPIKYDEHRTKLPRHIFRKAVLAEFPEPVGFESTALTEGYVKPLYLNPIYQRQIAIGRHGFPFNFNAGETYNYDKGICPVAERMYEKELLGVPIVREPLTTDDIDDLVHAIEKVLENATSIRAAFVDELEREEVLTPVDIANATHVR